MAHAEQSRRCSGMGARRHPVHGETYKGYIKLTFARGASLDDPKGLFNASLTGGTRRAIDIREGDEVNGEAFKALLREAVALNVGKLG